MIYARDASRVIRDEARKLYVHLVARIGVVPCGDGRTFRQALSQSGDASPWWYHPVPFKDCESDPTFNWIIALLTIRTVAEKHGLTSLVLVGAPEEVATVLMRSFTVEEKGTRKARPVWWLCLHGLAYRVGFAVREVWHALAVRHRSAPAAGSFEIVFSGFWDWSVWWNPHAQALADRYFNRLPDECKKHGLTSLGWFAWLAPSSEASKTKRRLRDVLAPLRGNEEVVILQSFLRPGDIVAATANFLPLTTFWGIRQRPIFKEVFKVKGLDLYPLFSGRLLYGFLNHSLPFCELVALATARACRRFRPKLAVSFLEHFPYARAHYEGVRRAGAGTICYAVQHASYNHEKTFLFLEPSIEFKGVEDGCAVPHPDAVCAMGTLGQELFLECGYAKDSVLLTGSPRYDRVGASSVAGRPLPGKEGAEPGGLRLLMVAGLDAEMELDMVEAVSAATRGLAGLAVFLRSHPFRRLERHPRFARFRGAVVPTDGSLEEDLKQADLVMFTYSTVAEEAFLLGKPVWQWLPLGFNGSALAETVGIPSFGSVAKLREALRAFQANPDAGLPGGEEQKLVLARLFNGGAGGAARVAAAVGERLREAAQ